MKHIKTYEHRSLHIDEPQVGDYVICRENFIPDKDMVDFISNNVGHLVMIRGNNIESAAFCGYIVQYENIPTDIRGFGRYDNFKNCRLMRRFEILHWSKNKEDLEIYIDTRKYNL